MFIILHEQKRKLIHRTNIKNIKILKISTRHLCDKLLLEKWYV